MKKSFHTFSLIVLLLFSNMASAKSIFVRRDSELKTAIKNVAAGDDIVFKNGIYQDFVIEFFKETIIRMRFNLR